MYQSIHSFTHVLEEVVKSQEHHEKQHSNDVKHCYVCDFSFSPFTSPSLFSFTFLPAEKVADAYAIIDPAFNKVTFTYCSLRAPPVLFI